MNFGLLLSALRDVVCFELHTPRLLEPSSLQLLVRLFGVRHGLYYRQAFAPSMWFLTSVVLRHRILGAGARSTRGRKVQFVG